MALERILVLDDEMVIRKALEEQLRRRRYSVVGVATLADATRQLEKDDFDLVFLDVRLPDGDGTELLERLAASPGSPLVVMITGHGSIESAVNCMRAGAFDYVIKPFSINQIDVVLKKAESFSQLVKVNQFLNQESVNATELIGDGTVMSDLRRLIHRVAPTEATVLISGENGTGKELVANELFRTSARSRQPFIRVNCAAISEALIESEFFGHEKGSFTGALQRREGRFELANNGTILLDEISEISLKVQAKLLRVLQEREFERVGGNKTIKVNVRVVATTNRDLLSCIERGEFRQDLYYRLNVFPIHVPPLREHGEDIPGMAGAFLERFSRNHGIRVKGIQEKAIQALIGHNWPGNVRELQNTIERAVILTEPGRLLGISSLGLLAPGSRQEAGVRPTPVPSPIVPVGNVSPEFDTQRGASAAPPVTGQTSDPGPEDGGPLPLEELEKRHILYVLKQTRGNRTQAANGLGISIRTLRNKLSAYRKLGEAIEGD